MGTAKDEVRQLLEGLPDDCSLEDIQYHLYVLEKIRNGLKAAARGTLLHEEVAERLGKWLTE